METTVYICLCLKYKCFMQNIMIAIYAENKFRKYLCRRETKLLLIEQFKKKYNELFPE